MPTFGFSAFLKLISLNVRPQRTLVRQRLSATQSGGYDFHRSLRLRANSYLVDGVPLPEVLRTINEIKRTAERESAKTGLERLGNWRENNTGSILSIEPVVFESPAKNFKVQFLPNFGIRLNGQTVAIHVWNTTRTELDVRMTYAALSLFPSLYALQEVRPDDIAVLSLPNSRLYRLSEVENQTEIGRRLIRRLDDLFEEVRREPERPIAPRRDRPATPPTA
ncbi:MAG: hypothetical protein P4M05_17360 [Bradyrhizobium sp.]|nr:hypothetical protein [Bradyrhizobium sp.]